MKKTLKVTGLLAAALPLMSFTNTMPYNSNVYLLPVAQVTTVLSRSNFFYKMMSTRNDTMAEFTFFYEILKMNHHSLAASWKNSYSINYCVVTELKKDVKYANGAFGWFTETGNTKIDHLNVGLKLTSFPSDLIVLNHTTDVTYTPYKVCYPENNRTSIYVNNSGGTTMAYFTDQEVYYSESTVNSLGLNALPTKFDIISSSTITANVSTNTFSQMDLFHYPNVLENGETFKTYGTLSFATDNLPTGAMLSLISKGVIAEGSPYGECKVTSSGYVDVIF